MSMNLNDLTHTYAFGSGTTANIRTPFVSNISEIKTTLIENTSDKSIRLSEYPKGFKILISQYADRVEYKTNYPLKEIKPNEFEVQFPQQ